MRLIFFVGSSPATDARSVASAFGLAAAAAGAELEAEVRLAGEAVLAADPAFVATVRGGDELRACLDRAGADGFDVSVCPTATDRWGINADQLLAIRGRPRPLAEILVEVAQGRSVLVHVG